MKNYLIDFFKYNNWANQKLLEVINQLPDKEESIKLFSHFIHAQDKWYNRIIKHVPDSSLSWTAPVLPLDELAGKWNKSVNAWIDLIETKTEDDLQLNVIFNRGHDGREMGIKLMDLCLQLNYHSIHHRAQINKLISQQGLTPPETDYIFTKLKEM